MRRMKYVSILLIIAVALLLGGCGEKKQDASFRIAIVNQSADPIGTLRYDYELKGNFSVEGRCKNYEDMKYTLVAPGGTFEMEIHAIPPYDEKLKLPAQMTMDLFICEDQKNCSGEEKAVEGKCEFLAEDGGVYTYILEGSWETGYTLTPADNSNAE